MRAAERTVLAQSRTIQLPLELRERRALLLGVDLLGVVISILVSLYIWSVRGNFLFDWSFLFSQLHWLAVFCLLWIIASAATNLYDARLAWSLGSVTAAVAKTSLIVLAGYLVIYYLTSPGSIPRGIAIFQSAAAVLLDGRH